MLIQYYLADGQQISYDTHGEMMSLYHIDVIAMMYAEKRPNDLPTHVYMHVSVYKDLVMQLSTRATSTSEGVYTHLQIWTSCGPLLVIPMPWAYDKFSVLVGKQEDYDRYNVDQVFEDVVLKDCERE